MALTTGRNTIQMGTRSIADAYPLPVKAGTKIYAGALVVLNGGYAAPGGVATGLIAAGRSETTVDNTNGADGAVSADVRPGIYRYKNSTAGDAIAQADAGTDCFIVDDETVAKTNGTNTRSRAGKIIGVDSNGVWVQLGIGV